MKTTIHVNGHKIRSNKKKSPSEPLEPVLTVKTYKSNQYGHQVIIYGQDGLEAARIVYRPHDPLSCGAHVWIESHNLVETLDTPVI